MADFPNIEDYVKWRGDLTFKQDNFSDVDAAVLCEMGYCHLDGLCQSGFSEQIAFNQIAGKIMSSKEMQVKYFDVGLMNRKIPEFFTAASMTNRFGNIKLCGYVSIIHAGQDVSTQIQFAAFTVVLDDKTICVVFRGTDDSVVGWKEDCNLALADEIPAQKAAAEYLENAGKFFKKHRIIVAGHSKGGNLALYACAKACNKVKKRILTVYNLDGPGFFQETLDSKEFRTIEKRVRSWFPYESVVGMLFRHFDDFKVAESNGFLIFQHDLLTWKVCGKDICIHQEGLCKGSLKTYEVFNRWIVKLDSEQKKTFIEALFSLLESTQKLTMASMFGDVQNDFNSSRIAYKGKMNEISSEFKNSDFKGKVSLVGKAALSVGKAIRDDSAALGKGVGYGVKSVARITKAGFEAARNKELMEVLKEIAGEFKSSL